MCYLHKHRWELEKSTQNGSSECHDLFEICTIGIYSQ